MWSVVWVAMLWAWWALMVDVMSAPRSWVTDVTIGIMVGIPSACVGWVLIEHMFV